MKRRIGRPEQNEVKDRRKNPYPKNRTRYTAADWFVGIWGVAGLAVAAVGIWNLIWSFQQ